MRYVKRIFIVCVIWYNLILRFLVCFIINIRIGYHYEKDEDKFIRKWKLSHCYGPTETYNYGKTFSISSGVKNTGVGNRSLQYRSENMYMHRCCLSPGIYNLICKNEKHPFGWGNASVEIFGQHYCDDFVGNMVVRKVKIKSRIYSLLFKFSFIITNR